MYIRIDFWGVKSSKHGHIHTLYIFVWISLAKQGRYELKFVESVGASKHIYSLVGVGRCWCDEDSVIGKLNVWEAKLTPWSARPWQHRNHLFSFISWKLVIWLAEGALGLLLLLLLRNNLVLSVKMTLPGDSISYHQRNYSNTSTLLPKQPRVIPSFPGCLTTFTLWIVYVDDSLNKSYYH